jgi:hypothetical protein
MSDDDVHAPRLLGVGDQSHMLNTILDSLSNRFDRFDGRFDSLSKDVGKVAERLARIESTDLSGRIAGIERAGQEHGARLTKIETLFLPITGLGAALVAGLGTWVFSLIPAHFGTHI